MVLQEGDKKIQNVLSKENLNQFCEFVKLRNLMFQYDSSD
jgi:hypothetical protein